MTTRGVPLATDQGLFVAFPNLGPVTVNSHPVKDDVNNVHQQHLLDHCAEHCHWVPISLHAAV
jgi:hypothetical protein